MNQPTNASNTRNTTPITSMEDLPWEMISELFGHLHPRDLVTCSLVNKRWHSIYTDFRSVDSLIELNPYGHLAHRWHHSGERIEEKELCDSKLLLRLFDRPLLSNLKRLVIFAETWPKFDLNKLNQFRQLVHLEIGNSDSDFFIESNEKVVLSLPKLEVLGLWIHSDEPRSLVVDCPVLSVFIYHGYFKETVELKHPETIKKLRGWMSGSELVLFKNVECFDALSFQAISRDTLLLLPKLKLANGLFRFGSDYRHAIGKDVPTQWWTIRNRDQSSRTVRDDPEQIVKWLERIREKEGPCANRQIKRAI